MSLLAGIGIDIVEVSRMAKAIDSEHFKKRVFTERALPLTPEEKKAWIATQSGVTCGSDAFFPFGDNVERARKSGVQYIAEPGGSIRDDNVIETADKYGIVMAFTGMRLFHH
jgi:phosphoribosylaminoimidazolecarboxamide formyltransferase/IMP cyclohydrolase